MERTGRWKRSRSALAEQFDLTEADLKERLPSGPTKRWVNTVAWALAHLKGAICVEAPRRGVYRVTDRGLQLLADTASDERIDVRALNAFEEYREFRSRKTDEADAEPSSKWEEAIKLCRQVLADRGHFEEREITYKHEIAAHIRAGLEAAEGSESSSHL